MILLLAFVQNTACNCYSLEDCFRILIRKVGKISSEQVKTNEKIARLQKEWTDNHMKFEFKKPETEIEGEKAIIVAGGFSDPDTLLSSVEAINSDGTYLCTLEDLPDNRHSQSMEDDILCGGYGDGYGYDTCLKFVEGSWINLGWNLKQKRSQHVSWKRPDGTI